MCGEGIGPSHRGLRTKSEVQKLEGKGKEEKLKKANEGTEGYQERTRRKGKKKDSKFASVRRCLERGGSVQLKQSP